MRSPQSHHVAALQRQYRGAILGGAATGASLGRVRLVLSVAPIVGAQADGVLLLRLLAVLRLEGGRTAAADMVVDAGIECDGAGAWSGNSAT